MEDPSPKAQVYFDARWNSDRDIRVVGELTGSRELSVIRYAYLWKREHDGGREEGTKDRPCAIVLLVLDDDGEQEVVVLPITHSAPQNVEDAIQIPPARVFRAK